MIMLTKRQLKILRVLIDDYISHAEPVGSRSISKRGAIQYSPATIRNDLADLEEMGFLEKTHSSSGRIPSEKGYRFYVDHLLSPFVFKHDELESLRALFAEKFTEIENVIQHSAVILSELTNYTSIVLSPESLETKLKHLQIIPISDVTAVAIIVTDTGQVENKTVEIPQGLDAADLEKIINILNERLQGVSLLELRNKMFKEIHAVLKSYVHNYEQAMRMMISLFSTNDKRDKVFYGGKTNILTQPEFRDIEKVRSLFDAIEEEELIYELIRHESEGIEVKIGKENDLQAMENCSVITASYSIGGENMGSIAIVGPTRMEYKRVISLLDFISKDLTNVLTKQYRLF